MRGIDNSAAACYNIIGRDVPGGQPTWKALVLTVPALLPNRCGRPCDQAAVLPTCRSPGGAASDRPSPGTAAGRFSSRRGRRAVTHLR